jgi:hypothetical protein
VQISQEKIRKISKKSWHDVQNNRDLGAEGRQNVKMWELTYKK